MLARELRDAAAAVAIATTCALIACLLTRLAMPESTIGAPRGAARRRACAPH